MIKKQIWINAEDRQRLRILAAKENRELMQMFSQNIAVYEQLKEIETSSGKSIEELIRLLVDVTQPEPAEHQSPELETMK